MNINSHNNSNNINNIEGNAVVIPINPDNIIRGYPNMEIPNKEGAYKEPSNESQQTPPPGLTGCNNNKQPHDDDNQFQNSNRNGNINKHFVANPSWNNTNTTNTTDINGFSNYSQSPFNPLAMNNYDTRDENKREKCEELSLASNHFKLFVDETLKKVSEPSGNNLRARLLIPEDNRSARWGLKIFGAQADLVAAAKKEIMRSPALTCQDDEVDMETSLRTSKTIESLLFEEGDEDIMKGSLQEQNVVSIDFPTLASLSGSILGPKYHVIKEALTEFDCTISWDGALFFIPTNSSLNLRVSGKDPKAVSSVVDLLKSRSDRIDEIQLAVTTLVIDSGKLDWIYSSGAINHVEEALWKTGGTLTQLSDSIYQVTCLSGALLSSCLKRIHEILSLHQSAHFTFRFKNDFRDFSTKCANVFETLAQVTDCSVSQKCGNGSVEVEIGGNSRDLARALIRLDTFRSQIFETGSFDLKLVERRLRLHVPAEIREFICGKKDGKLIRIIKETGVNISLNGIGGDSMYVDLIVDDHMGINFGSNALLHALRLMEGELPSELTFHVPEVHHKRMIGHGGKVIQRIMKKWGVYVKFMNSHETAQCHQLTDPLSEKESSFVPLDNVVVRTPSKNGQALKAIKDEIFEECSVSEVTGQFDSEAFKSLQRVQSSSKSRVIVSLPTKHRQSLPTLLRLIKTNPFINSSLSIRKEEDLIVLEGEKEEIGEMISLMAEELKNEISVQGESGEIIIKSPKLMTSKFNFDNYNNNLTSEASFKFFPSALFVVQSQQSLSAAGSPILSSDSISTISATSLMASNDFPSPSSSIAMNSLASLNSSPPLPVGYGKKLFGSRSDEEINFALAETRRRSADIF